MTGLVNDHIPIYHVWDIYVLQGLFSIYHHVKRLSSCREGKIPTKSCQKKSYEVPNWECSPWTLITYISFHYNLIRERLMTLIYVIRFVFWVIYTSYFIFLRSIKVWKLTTILLSNGQNLLKIHHSSSCCYERTIYYRLTGSLWKFTN